MTIATPPRHPSQDVSPFKLLLLVLMTATAVIVIAHPAGIDVNFSNETRGSGVGATQTRNEPAFKSIDLAGVSTVNVHIGAAQSVVVRADDNLIDHVTTDVKNGTLVIAERGNFSTKHPISVDVTVSSLDKATLSGSGFVNVTGVHATRFSVIEKGSGVLTVAGTADQLHARLSGSGNLELQDLIARDVDAILAGSGRLQVHATGKLEASIPGSGAIIYTGNPNTVKQRITGSGAIIKG
jgi:putative autotransporter adhesin-like protein